MAIFGDNLPQGVYSLEQGCGEQEARNLIPYLLFPPIPPPALPPCIGCQGYLFP